MGFFNLFKKQNSNTKKTIVIETEILYTNKNNYEIIEGIEFPKSWNNLNNCELKEVAKKAIIELSESSNSDFKAKQLGFNNAKHLIKLCFDYILK